LVPIKNAIKTTLLSRDKQKDDIDFNSLDGRELISCYSHAIADNLCGIGTRELSHKEFLRETKLPTSTQIAVKKGFIPNAPLTSITIHSYFNP